MQPRVSRGKIYLNRTREQLLKSESYQTKTSSFIGSSGDVQQHTSGTAMTAQDEMLAIFYDKGQRKQCV